MIDAFGLSVMSIYSALHLHSELSLFTLGVVLLVAFDAVVIAQMFIYKTCSDMNTVSCHLNKWKQECKNKLLRKQLRSCYPLKVHIGKGSNYFNETTPLVVTHMTLKQTVNALLIAN